MFECCRRVCFYSKRRQGEFLAAISVEIACSTCNGEEKGLVSDQAPYFCIPLLLADRVGHS